MDPDMALSRSAGLNITMAREVGGQECLLSTAYYSILSHLLFYLFL